jgi:formate/nitrite transporter FocA (FNT family)
MNATAAGEGASAGAAAGESSPHLDRAERRQAAAHAAPKALVIHEVLRAEGELELARSPSALAWSGLAAGLSMGFSFLTPAVLQSQLPGEPWVLLCTSLAYSVGFVICILGRQQLYTETTLTATLPFLVRRDRRTFGALLRMSAIVLVSNLLGTLLFARLLTWPGLFPQAVTDALSTAAVGIVTAPTGPTFIRAVLAGWLIALMVWLLPGARSSRLFVVMLITTVVALGHFPHIVAGSADAAYAVWSDHARWRDYALGFLLPTLLGNTLGGVMLAAMLNHAPLTEELTGDASAARQNAS